MAKLEAKVPYLRDRAGAVMIVIATILTIAVLALTLWSWR